MSRAAFHYWSECVIINISIMFLNISGHIFVTRCIYIVRLIWNTFRCFVRRICHCKKVCFYWEALAYVFVCVSLHSWKERQFISFIIFDNCEIIILFVLCTPINMDIIWIWLLFIIRFRLITSMFTYHEIQKS